MGTPPVPHVGLSASTSAGKSKVYDTDASREEEGARKGGRDGDVTPATAAAAEKSFQEMPTLTGHMGPTLGVSRLGR